MDSSTLAGIETLIAAGLNSKNQIIVSDTLNMWKETFEFEASLVHPPVIRLALMRLRPITDMKLSDSPDGDVNEVSHGPIPFKYDGQRTFLTSPRSCHLPYLLLNPKTKDLLNIRSVCLFNQ